MRIGQVNRLQNDINFSKTPCIYIYKKSRVRNPVKASKDVQCNSEVSCLIGVVLNNKV